MNFGERLVQLRKQYGYNTRNEFAEKLEIPSTTLRNYETGVREPGHTFLKQISELFNVSVDYLLGLSEDKEVLNSIRLKISEQTHIERYRTLDNYGKEIVDFVLLKEWERKKELDRGSLNKETAEAPYRFINYYYRLASAGTGQILFDMPPTKTIEIPDIKEYKYANYALGVNGSSMEPTYIDGDTLLVEMAETIEIGEIGIFLVDGECYVKELGIGELISLNPKNANIPLSENSKCMGKVIGKL